MRKLLLAPAVLAPALLLALSAGPPPGSSKGAPDDLVFEGGRVADGTGAPLFLAELAVKDGRIAAIGRLADRPARRRIDARGLVVAPGFIDLLGQSEYNVLVDPRAASKITQGITTEVTGGWRSLAPLDEKLLAEGEDVY